ncbi:hypothetical protein [Paenibacillus mendelii]|uniref:Alanine racemase N-terminal domain-containing protein n=1 Tax=Paenibacillus mendelii TaxID=206163 RepID=A0ABV6J295_9BACL|nr:hypothetical protein [Paenibacillus mendelii]MCQ6560525.1 hypothetical protein [Paenibacillus mendelii]
MEEIETPAVLVDLDLLDRNLRQTAEVAGRAGVKLRPHIKTHKSIWIRQTEAGAASQTDGARQHYRKHG